MYGTIRIVMGDEPYEICDAVTIDIIIADIRYAVFIHIACVFLVERPIKPGLQTDISTDYCNGRLCFEIRALIDKDIYLWHINAIFEIGVVGGQGHFACSWILFLIVRIISADETIWCLPAVTDLVIGECDRLSSICD
jgi:hypothetical protein